MRVLVVRSRARIPRRTTPRWQDESGNDVSWAMCSQNKPSRGGKAELNLSAPLHTPLSCAACAPGDVDLRIALVVAFPVAATQIPTPVALGPRGIGPVITMSFAFPATTVPNVVSVVVVPIPARPNIPRTRCGDGFVDGRRRPDIELHRKVGGRPPCRRKRESARKSRDRQEFLTIHRHPFPRKECKHICVTLRFQCASRAVAPLSACV